MAKKNQKQQNKVDAIESVVLNFSTEGWGDYEYWVEEDIDTVKKINKLIKPLVENIILNKKEKFELMKFQEILLSKIATIEG